VRSVLAVLPLALAASLADSWADAWPQWSPDGSQIVFASTRDGDWEIYTMGADGTNPQRLTHSPGRDAHPMFMPGGRRIVFQSPRGHAVADQVDLYLMDADGRHPRRIVAAPGFNGVPVPSPDGAWIAFQRSPRARAGAGYHWELFLVDSAGRRERQLTANAWSSQVPTWSPDGGRLAFHADPEGRNQLFVLEVTSGAVVPLAPSAGDDNAPAWSPDGRSLAFVSTRDGARDVYRVEVASGGVTRLTTGLDVWGQPSWSPDGTVILFSAKTAGLDQIYAIGAHGAGLRRLTGPPLEAEGVLADSLRRFAVEMVQRLRDRDVDGVIALYGDTLHFVHVDGGQVIPWSVLALSMRGYLSTATSNPLSLVGEPGVTIIDADNAVVYARHRFEGVPGHPPHEGVWSGVLHRFREGWRIVHSHSSDTEPDAPQL